MKFITNICIVLMCATSYAQEYVEVAKTSHFIIKKRPEIILTGDETKALIDTLEIGYQKVSTFLGEKANSQIIFNVLLDGEGLPENQMPNYPSVDSDATIRLYHFPGPGSAFLQGLPHELVHAFRNDLRKYHESVNDYLKGYGFVEEGFAEFVATLVHPSNVSFPRYGYPLEIVTNYWFLNNSEIPLDVLFNHHEINPKCVAQAYPLRASFFTFLYQAFGKEKLFALAYYAKPYSIATFKEIYGKPFDSLNNEWKLWAAQQYDQYENNKNLLQDFTDKTPIKYFPVCESGKDW